MVAGYENDVCIMMTFIPTPHGAGVRLWGTQDELREFYETLERYWNPLDEARSSEEYQRDNILACFCYDVRHGFMGMRTVSKQHPVHKTPGEYYAVEITWTHVLFYFAVLRYNMHTRPCTKKDVKLICLAEDALRDAISAYSKRYSDAMMPFLDGAVYCGNPHLMQYMEDINYDHLHWLRFSSPKEAFGHLASAMEGAVYNSFNYRDILRRLQKNAKRLGCEISQLTYDYDQPPFDFKW